MENMKTNYIYGVGIWLTFLMLLWFKLSGSEMSWWWVFAPFWIPSLLAFTVAFVVGFAVAFKRAFKNKG